MSDMLEAALQYGAACKRLVNCKLENANEQITAALFDEIKRLRAERAELLAAIEAMRVAGGAAEFQRAFDEAKIIAARKGEGE